MGILDYITDWLKGKPPSFQTDPSKFIPASQNPEYPTSDDVNFARQNDYSYASPYAREFEGKSKRLLTESDINDPYRQSRPVKGRTFTNEQGFRDDALAKAQLAANRSALATVGFDPTKMALDYTKNPDEWSELGRQRYIPQKNIDDIWAIAKAPSAVMHESIHRGVDKLSHTLFWNQKFDPFLSKDPNEYLIRHLMMTKMGDPEVGLSKEETDMAKTLGKRPAYRDLVDQLENAAAQYLAAKRPGGPR